MGRTLTIKHLVVYLGIPGFLFLLLIVFLKSSFYYKEESLTIALTLDLLVTIPLIYFLLIRKSSIPKTTVIPIMILGVLIGTYFLPESSQTYLSLFKNWCLPFIEVFVVLFVIKKVQFTIKTYKKQKHNNLDFVATVQKVSAELLPQSLVRPFTTEVAIFYYGFVDWKTRVVRENEFSYHKKSGTPALLTTLIFVLLIETSVLHILLEKWSPMVAWILSALSIYSVLQLWGVLRSLSKRFITINENHLQLYYGLLSEVKIAVNDIEHIELSRKPIKEDQGLKKLSPLGDFDTHNIVLKLKKNYTSIGLYGTKRSFHTIALFIDEPNEFKTKIEQMLAGK